MTDPASTPPPRRPLPLADALAIGVWAAVTFGLAEGSILALARLAPLLQAAYKVPNEVIWVAPLVGLPIHLALAVVLSAVARIVPVRFAGRSPAVAVAVHAFFGAATVAATPGYIGRLGSVLFALGVAAFVHRQVAPAAADFVMSLRKRIAWAASPVAAAAALVALWGWGTERVAASRLADPQEGAPNVLMVVLDTVRRDRFHDRSGPPVAPNLEAFFRRGVTYTDAWSTTSWSLPSQGTFLTGLLPHQHGADWPEARLRDDVTTLPEVFAARGYATGAFSGNSSWVTPEYLGRGFLRFRVYVPEDVVRRTENGRRLDDVLDEIGYDNAGRGKKAPAVNAQFLSFLDDHAGRPFFAYLCYMDVNQALHARKLNRPDLGPAAPADIAAAADEGLRKLDADFADLLAELERRKLLDSTIVAVVSDHGESFGDDGTKCDHRPSGHATSLYPEQVRVPMAIVGPGVPQPGARVTRAVSVVGLAGTVADLAGARGAVPGPRLPLHPDAAGDPEPVVATLRFHLADDVARTAVVPPHQYIRTYRESRGLVPKTELFDLGADPRGWTDLAEDDAHAATRSRLADVLRVLVGPEPSAETR